MIHTTSESKSWLPCLGTKTRWRRNQGFICATMLHKSRTRIRLAMESIGAECWAKKCSVMIMCMEYLRPTKIVVFSHIFTN